MEAIFGYGSLILPTSLIGRFDPELREKRDKIKKEGNQEEFLSLYLEDRSIDKWEISDINFVPVKIYGLKRFYSFEYYEKGNMLAAEEADSEHYINGVLIFPLDSEQFEKVAETEKGYKTLIKTQDEIEPYISEDKLAEKGLKLPEEVKVFVADDVEMVNKNTGREKLESYHQYIPNGVKLLANVWFDKKNRKQFERQFMEDFCSTTFEIDQNGRWKRLSEK